MKNFHFFEILSTYLLFSSMSILKEELTNCTSVEFKNQKYSVFRVPYKDSYILFVTDYNDKDLVLNHNWIKCSANYVGTTIYVNGEKKILYIHNYLFNNLDFNGKGQSMTVDHINRIGTDNRRLNLRRNRNQSQQNFNQGKRERTESVKEILLMNNIDPEMIPKCVYYYPEDGNFGEYFGIEIKALFNSEQFRKKTSKSKKYSLRLKLEEAKLYLRELIQKHPELFEDRLIRHIYHEEVLETIKDYNEIIQMSGLDIDQKCLIKITELVDYLHPQLDELTSEELKFLNSCSINVETCKKGVGIKLPINCGITSDMIPKYVHYTAETEKRGDKFVIEKHPNLEKRSVGSSGSKAISTKKKFIEILTILNNLEKTNQYTELIQRIQKQ